MKKVSAFIGIILIVVGVGGIVSYMTNKQQMENMTELNTTWEFDAQSLQELDVSTEFELEVAFVRSTDGRNTIVLEGEGTENMVEAAHNAKITNGKLALALKHQTNVFFLFGFMDRLDQKAKQKLTVSVADELVWEQLQLSNNIGSLKLSGTSLITLDQASLQSDAGKIVVNDFTGKRLRLQASAGNIEVNGSDAELTAITDAGNLTLKDIRGPADLKVSAGNVKLYKLDTSSVEIDSSAGNVYVQVPASFAGSYDLKSDIGKVRAPDGKNESLDVIKVRSSVGNITVEH